MKEADLKSTCKFYLLSHLLWVNATQYCRIKRWVVVSLREARELSSAAAVQRRVHTGSECELPPPMPCQRVAVYPQ